MYKIMIGETLIGIAAPISYVKMLDNGYYGLCCAAEAEGVAFDGVVYPITEVSLEQTYESTLTREYIEAQQDSADLLDLFATSVDDMYNADLEEIENV